MLSLAELIFRYDTIMENKEKFRYWLNDIGIDEEKEISGDEIVLLTLKSWNASAVKQYERLQNLYQINELHYPMKLEAQDHIILHLNYFYYVTHITLHFPPEINRGRLLYGFQDYES